jgi:hypothetical protein
MPSPTELPDFSLCGPLLPGSSSDYFWNLHLIAPNYKDATQQIDRIHPIRTLLLDANRGTDTGYVLPPRLINAYLTSALIGDLSTSFSGSYDRPVLQVALKSGAPLAAKLKNVHTRPVNPNGAETDGVHHITASPLPKTDDLWQVDDNERDNIQVPSFQIQQGSIPLVLEDSSVLTNLLGNSVTPIKDTKLNKVVVWMVRDGIEITAKVSFLGIKFQDNGHPTDTTGVFLLSPASPKTFRLTLLTDRLSANYPAPTSTYQQWFEAWTSIVDPAKGGNVPGYQVDLARDRLPSLSWTYTIDGTGSSLKPVTGNPVTVPGSAISVRMAGPQNREADSGEVDLSPQEWSLQVLDSTTPTPYSYEAASASCTKYWGGGTGWETAWHLDPAETAYKNFIGAATASGAPQRYLLSAAIIPTDVAAYQGPPPPPPPPKGAPKSDWVDLQVANAAAKVDVKCLDRKFIFDELDLARSLRAAQQIPEPSPGLAIGDLERPFLWCFTVLDDGWLQFPALNQPAPDPNKDYSFLQAVTSDPPNVLSGFLSFGERVNLGQNLSASVPTKLFPVKKSPWGLIVLGAEAASVAVVIDQAAKAPSSAFVRMIRPQMETDGWLWLSSDCPDGLEAIPRIGAGPGQYLDVPLRLHTTEPDPFINLRLNNLAFGYARDAVTGYDQFTQRSMAIDLFFNPAMQDWQAYFKHQKVEGEYLALTGTKLDPQTINLFPCIRWQRHQAMPLVSTMPMTRSVTAAIPPVESRDLVPFIFQPIETDSSGKTPLTFRWDTSIPIQQVLPALTPVNLKPALGWPWAWNIGDLHEGIALAALGAPGGELSFFDFNKPSQDPWTDSKDSLRFDIPALDEAFANAKLPPAAPVPGADKPEAPATEPPSTALEWSSMARLWRLRKDHHTLARVMHSHIVRYTESGKPGNARDLVGKLTWPVNGAFQKDSTTANLPYGTIKIAGKILTGNAALIGYENTAETVNKPNGSTYSVNVLGYAPETIQDGNFLRDSRAIGLQASGVSKGALQRTVSYLQKPTDTKYIEVTLLTLQNSYTVEGLQFGFWFKDLPIAGGKLLSDFDPGRAWQDDNLPFQGGEWRLWSTDTTPGNDAQSSLESGENLLPFFGFALEPLQLLECETDATGATLEIAKAVIVCLLHLGPKSETPNRGNLVKLTLEPGSAAGLLKWTGLDVVAPAGRKLSFSFQAGDRPVTLETVPSWNAGNLAFARSTLTVSLFGQDVSLANPTITLKPTNVWIQWPAVPNPRDKATAVAAGTGKFGIESLTIVVTTQLEQNVPDPYVSDFTRWIVLLPDEETSTGRSGIPAIFVRTATTFDGNKTIDTTDVTLCGMTFRAKPTVSLLEFRGSIALCLDQEPFAPLPAFSKTTVSLGLVAALKLDASGTADLGAGSFQAEVCDTDAKGNALPRIVAEATKGNRGKNQLTWVGQITLYFTHEITNLIQWPKVDMPSPAAWVPFTDADHRTTVMPKDPTVDVTFTGTTSRQHKIAYDLWGHTVSFVAASALADPTAPDVITLPVQAKHTLDPFDNTERKLSFVSVETIAIGRLNGLVPIIVPPGPGQEYDKDPYTFGARYNTKPNPARSPLPAMHGAGTGRLYFMLMGAFGLPLRVALHQPQIRNRNVLTAANNPIMLAGGFAGLVTWDDLAQPTDLIESPMIRLPVLAPLTIATEFKQLPQNGGKKQYSWADRGIKNIEMRLRLATTPATKAYADLLAAFRLAAGSDLGHAAMLVEQAFPPLPELDDPGIALPPSDKTVYFPAAAIAVQRLFTLAKSPPRTNAFTPYLSPTAVVALVCDQNNQTASLRPTQSTEAELPAPLQPQSSLVTVGLDIVISDWPDAPPGSAPASENNSIPIRLKAAVDHPQPLVALIGSVTKGKAPVYSPYKIASPRRRLDFKLPPATVQFPEPQRGYPVAPDVTDGKDFSWLYPAEENITKIIRDEVALKDVLTSSATLTGIAGLSRSVTLPRQALDVPLDSKVQKNPLFVSETRAPVYQPDAVYTDLPCDPIGWLSPGYARPRLPGPDQVSYAIQGLYRTKMDSTKYQWLVPSGMDLASVGDRSGISLARVTRLETALAFTDDFDGTLPRFGHIAQGSAWYPRTERTPRPGRLPKNVYPGPAPSDPAPANRRPCPSQVWLDTSCDLVRGPADIIQGEYNDIAWTAKFVGAPEWEGMVPERWDGSLTLKIEIDLANTATIAGYTPTDFLNLIFHTPGTDATTLANTASLIIDDTILPYQTISVVAPAPFAASPNNQPNRAVITAILRLTAGGADPNQYAAQVAAAFTRSGLLPKVELRLNVFAEPSDNAALTLPTPPPPPAPSPIVVFALGQSGPAAINLPYGETRPPVTLRMPLSPILAQRGALPMPRHSLVFSDPDYDRSLGSMPEIAKLVIKPNPFPSGFDNRGQLYGYLYADRAKSEVNGRLLLMADFSFERPLPNSTASDDYDAGKMAQGFKLEFKRIVSGVNTVSESLYLYDASSQNGGSTSPNNVMITPGQVYEIPVSLLRDEDGNEVLNPGDILNITLSTSLPAVLFYDPSDSTKDIPIHLPENYSLTLTVEISATPVAEPPPALYAAMLLRRFTDPGTAKAASRISVPLHAQSPYPWRIAPINAKRDFRAGFVRRSAFFIWSLARPTTEWSAPFESSVYLQKTERSGQTYLPVEYQEFTRLRCI